MHIEEETASFFSPSEIYRGSRAERLDCIRGRFNANMYFALCLVWLSILRKFRDWIINKRCLPIVGREG
jgi:hypothetical protein